MSKAYHRFSFKDSKPPFSRFWSEKMAIFTRMRKPWIPGALLDFFKRLGTRLTQLTIAGLRIVILMQRKI